MTYYVYMSNISQAQEKSMALRLCITLVTVLVLVARITYARPGSGVSTTDPASSCKEIYNLYYGQSRTPTNGFYTLYQPNNYTNTYSAYCDMTNSGGGWTWVLKMKGGSTSWNYDSLQWTSTLNSASVTSGWGVTTDFTDGKSWAYHYVSGDNLAVFCSTFSNIAVLSLSTPSTVFGVINNNPQNTQPWTGIGKDGWIAVDPQTSYPGVAASYAEGVNLNYGYPGYCGLCAAGKVPKLRLGALGFSGNTITGIIGLGSNSQYDFVSSGWWANTNVILGSGSGANKDCGLAIRESYNCASQSYCSGNGYCTSSGCVCSAGFSSTNCATPTLDTAVFALYKAENNCLDSAGKYNLVCTPASTSIVYSSSVSSLGNAFDLNNGAGASVYDTLTVAAFGTSSTWTGITISFWIKPSQLASCSVLSYGSGTSQITVSLTSSNVLSFTIGGTSIGAVSSSLGTGSWRQVAFTWTLAYTFNLYIDGQPVYTTSGSSVSGIQGGLPLFIGQSNPPALANRYVGAIDQIMIAARVFELKEINSFNNKTYLCYEVVNTDTLGTCQGRGTCVAPNTCQCSSGWSGANCNTAACYYIPITDPTACSNGNGTCVASNTCNCKSGYYGSQCEAWSCGGVQFNSTNVCSTNGTCIAPNTCSCKPSFYGNNCEAWNCYGVIMNSTSTCSSNGTCQAPDTCSCKSGFYGNRCEAWNCYGTIMNSTTVCSTNGSCTAPDQCTCRSGYYGSKCEAYNCNNIIFNSTAVCSTNGTCQAPDTCSCKPGFYGANCEAWKCSGVIYNSTAVCSTNGTCQAPDTCSCKPGFYGKNCEAWNCYGTIMNSTNACSSNGSCTAPDTCTCKPGYYGSKCEAYNCNYIIFNSTNVCSTNGTCQAPDTCSCKSGFYGQNCEAWRCNGVVFNSTAVCSTNGTCQAPDRCSCKQGFYGQNCEAWNCYGVIMNSTSTCSSNGTCVAPDTCTCRPGYYGAKCEAYNCYGIIFNSSAVCSNRQGQCISPDQCSCAPCYTGSECEFNYCTTASITDTHLVQQNAGYVGQSYPIVIKYGRTIPAYISTRYRCLLDGLQVPTTNNSADPTQFTCVVSKTAISSSSITLQYNNPGEGIVVVSSNSIPFSFVTTAALSINTATSYDISFIGASSTKDVQTSTMVSTLLANVTCYHNNNNVTLSTSVTNSQQFACVIPSEATPRYINISLWFYGNANTKLLLSSSPIIIPVLNTGPITYNTNSMSAAYVNSVFTPSISLTSWLPQNLVNRVFISLDKATNGTVVLWSEASTNFAVTMLNCTVTSTTPGNRAVYLYIKSFSGLPALQLSSTTIPAIFVEHVTAKEIYPFATLISTSSQPVTLTIASPTSSGVLDTYYNYGSNVVYSCSYTGNSSFFSATWNPSTGTVTCNLPSPSGKLTTSVTTYITTVATGTILPWSAPTTFYFMVPVTFTYLYPFVSGYVPSTNVEVRTSDSLLTTLGLYCFFPPSVSTQAQLRSVATALDASLTRFGCAIQKSAFTTQNTEYSNIYLQYNTNVNSSQPDSYFNVTSNNVMFTYIKTPIDFASSPIIFDPSSVTNTYQMSFLFPTSYTGLSVTIQYLQDTSAIVDADVLTGAWTNVSCVSVSDMPMNCTIGSIVPLYTPLNISTRAIVSRAGQTEQIVLSSTQHYYKQPINILSALPYFTDTYATSSTPTIFTFKTDVRLNPLFSFVCSQVGLGKSVNVSATRLTDRTQFTCSLTSLGADHTTTVSLLFNYTQPTVLASPTLSPFYSQNLVENMTGNAGYVEFNTLGMSPTYMLASDVTSVFTMAYKSSLSTPYSVPSANRNASVILKAYDSSKSLAQQLSYPTSISLGTVSFMKNATTVKDGSTVVYDIQNLNWVLYQLPSTYLSPINQSTVLYNQNQIINRLPYAVLRSSMATITYTFNVSTSYVQPNQGFNLYAKTGFTDSNRLFPCASATTAAAGTKLVCNVTYDATQLVGDYIPVYPHFKASTISNNDTLLSLNTNDDFTKLYYLDSGAISYPSNQVQLFLTNTTFDVVVQFTTTSLPNVTLIKNRSIYCYYYLSSSSRIITRATYTDEASVGGGYIMYSYTCTQKFPIGAIGVVSLSLWYNDTVTATNTITSEGVAFQLSNNTLELIVTDTATLNNIDPLVGRVNGTATPIIQTSVNTTVSYGGAIYYVVAIFNDTSIPTRNITLFRSQGYGNFLFTITATLPTSVEFNLWMSAKGTNIQLSTVPVMFTFVDGYFLTPSYGTIKGGEYVILDDYTIPPSFDPTIYFSDYPNYFMNCTAYAAANTTNLNCTTPSLPASFAFKSYYLTLMGKKLSVRYIVYDPRTTSTLTPRVFYTNSPETLNIGLNAPVTVGTVEGNPVVQIQHFSDSNNAIRTTLSPLNNVQNFTYSFQTLSAGVYNFSLMYYNPNLFEIRSMIPFTSVSYLGFVDMGSLQYYYNINAGFTNTTFNVTVQLNAVYLKLIRQNLQCVFENATATVVTTTDITDSVGGSVTVLQCSVYSATPVLGQLSVWVTSPYVKNGGLKLSTNTLSVAIMESISLNAPTPWATKSQNQTFNITTSITSSATLFTNELTYSCLFYQAGDFYSSYNVSAMQIAGTTQFTCALNLISLPSTSTYYNVYLTAVSTATGQNISVSNNFVPIYVIIPVQLSYLSPIARQIVSSSETVQMTLTTSANTSIITDRSLYCKYSTVDQTAWNYAVATRLSSTQVSCTITTVHALVPNTETVSMTLWYNAGGLDLPSAIANVDGYAFDLSTNNVTLVYVPPLNFTDLSVSSFDGVVNRATYLNKYLPLNYIVPNVGSLSYAVHLQWREGSGYGTLRNCTWTVGSYATCIVVPNVLANVTRVPVTLNFTLTINNTISGESYSQSILPLKYVENTNITKANPFIFSYVERKSQGAAVSFSLSRTLNTDLTYWCIVSNGISTYNTSVVWSTGNNFTCVLKSFGFEGTATVSIVFNSNTPYAPTKFITISEQQANIAFVSDISLVQSNIPTSSASGSIILQNANALPTPPTSFYSNSQYQMTMIMNDRGKNFPLTNCNVVNRTIQCNMIDMSGYMFPKVPYTMKVDLYSMGVRALTLSPLLNFFKPPVIYSSTLPSLVPPTYDTTQVLPDVVFTGDNFFISSTYPISITYLCDNCYSAVTNTNTQTNNCKFISSAQIACPAPRMNFNFTTMISKQINVSVIVGGITFPYTTMLQPVLYDPTSIKILSLSKSIVSTFISDSVTVFGQNFISGPVLVRFFDYASYSFVSTSAIVQSANAISITTPAMWQENIIYPRQMYFGISFDGGNNYITNPSLPITYSKPQDVSSSPSNMPAGSLVSNLQLFNFPVIELNQNTSLVLVLLDNSTNTEINVTCNSAFTSCSGLTLPQTPTILTWKLYYFDSITNKRLPTFVNFANNIVVYTKSLVSSISPTNVVLGITDQVRVLGTFPNVDQQLVRALTQVGGTYVPLQVVLANTTYVIVAGFLRANSYYSSSRRLMASAVSFMISFNNGTYYETVASNTNVLGAAQITLVPGFSMQGIENTISGEPDTVYSFLKTPLLIDCGVVPDSDPDANTIIRFRSSLITKQFLASDLSLQIQRADSTMTMTAPLFSEITGVSQTQFLFPYVMIIGISLNGGSDYVERTIYYQDSFARPIVTGISPTITPRFAMNVTLTGKLLDSAQFCIYRIGNVTVYNATVIVPRVDSNITRICPVPLALANSAMNISITLQNANAESATPFTLYFQEPIMITAFTPSSGSTVGGGSITIWLSQPAQFIPYIRFSDLIGEACTLSDAKLIVTCSILPHIDGKARVMLSYNRVDWYMWGGMRYVESNYTNYVYTPADAPYMYTYIPCGIGMEAIDFNYNCTACKPGYYKPTAGIYACIPCQNSTFQSSYMSGNCTLCPVHSTSAPNSTDVFGCVCDVGYYRIRNPATYNDICSLCPKGALCNGMNVTQPLAKPGYWWDPDDYNTFYVCAPAESCPGGGARNCTPGYTSRVCGLCENGYYKFNRKCTVCDPQGWWKLLLAVIALGVVTVAFFAISSVKISHISSLSIAFSYYQVVAIFSQFDNVQWPFLVQGAFTVSSASNFNIDFISPQCLFPEINFQTKWVLTTLLPLYFLAAFFLLYICGELRALIVNRTGRFIKIPYLGFKEEPVLADDVQYTRREQINIIKQKIICFVLNMLIWIRNFLVWLIKGQVTRHQMRNFFNKCINSYTALLSFIFVFIISQASQIFVCTRQVNGSLTMDASPDIFCFKSESWFMMLPLSIVIYSFFGIGSILFFVFLYTYSKYLKRKGVELAKKFRISKINATKKAYKEAGTYYKINQDTMDQPVEQDIELLKLKKEEDTWKKRTKDFDMRYKFMLSRFKRKYFYWEAVITFRKLTITILKTFLKPMLVVVFGIAIIFFALLLHIYAVPFRYKFHNIMEYAVLISTFLTLFFGLLFFVDRFPTDGTKQFAVWLATVIMLASTVGILLMIVWDFFTRRKKEKKLVRARKAELVKKLGEMRKNELAQEYKKMFPGVMSNRKYYGDSVEWISYANPLVEDPELYQAEDHYLEKTVNFEPPFYNSDDDIASDEAIDVTLSEITDNLFGRQRIKKKFRLLKAKKDVVVKKAKDIEENLNIMANLQKRTSKPFTQYDLKADSPEDKDSEDQNYQNVWML